MGESIHHSIREKLNSAQHILVTSHVRADGDAVGAVLGMGLSLQASGKDVQMVLADGISHVFRHLTGSEQVSTKPKGHFDMSIVLDCSDLLRIGGILGDQKPDINIDHHITNLNFAYINLVENEAESTSGIIGEHLPEWGLVINKPVAEALLTGIITDTIGFRTSNTTAKTMRLSASLMEKGADLPNLYFRALIERSLESAHYWGAGLQNLQREGHLVWTSLTLEDRARANYPGNDDADLVNLLSTIEDIDIAIIFVEQKNGKVKVSWRARPGWDVSRIALQFSGGGHLAASGAEIDGSFSEVQDKVLKATRNLINENSNGQKPGG